MWTSERTKARKRNPIDEMDDADIDDLVIGLFGTFSEADPHMLGDDGVEGDGGTADVTLGWLDGG